MNDELINSAVSFLQDPNVASAPLNKKIEFLETKGLNEQEIEEALKRANGLPSQTSTSSTATTPSSSTASSYGGNNQYAQPPVPYDYYGVAPPPPERSWKDYFIMATATAGVSYGLYQVVTRYLIPSIIPPSQTRIDADKEKIDEEFIKIDKVLEQMTNEQKDIKDANTNKLKDIDVAIDNINDFLTKYNKDKLKFDDDLRLMKLEVDNLKNSVEKNMKLTKENILEELSEITEELGSLKNLIKARSEAQSNNPAPASRKVAPVSSIPSASEILKKAKAKSYNDLKKLPETSSSQSPPQQNATSAVPSPIPGYPASTTLKEIRPSTPGNIFAAGIPEWQLKHKQAEEEEERKKMEQQQQQQQQQEGSSEKETENQAEKQSQTQPGQASQDQVNASIKNVGVPAWQLNAGQ